MKGALPGWWRDSDFWTAVRPVLFDEPRWEDARILAPALVGLARLQAPDLILDVSAGPGRFTLPLLDLGLRVAAWDPNPAYLVELQRRVRESGREDQLLVASGDPQKVRAAVAAEGGAHAAFWLDTSHGYEGRTGDLRRLSWIRDCLRGGARLLVEGLSVEGLDGSEWSDPEWQEELAAATKASSDVEPAHGGSQAVWRLKRSLQGDTPREAAPPLQEPPPGHIKRHDSVAGASGGDSWLEARWDRYARGVRTSWTYRHLLYSLDDWSDVMREAGFVNVLCEHELWSRTYPQDFVGEARPDGSMELSMTPATRASSVWLAHLPASGD